jgi:MoaA/NifB/PqqE/SkfB family radical SAM enzyme
MKVYNIFRLYKLAYTMYFKRASLLTKLSCGVRLCRRKLGLLSAPVSTIIGVTYACQCRCKHCGMDMNDSLGQETLTLEQIKKLLRDARALGVVEITLFGGEPLLRNDIDEIVSYARDLQMLPTVDTNGLLLSSERVATLKACGIACIKVSLDSPFSQVHDQLRGIDGCFEKAVAGLCACVEQGVPCIISTYATKENLASGDLNKLIEFGRELGVAGVRILDTVLSGCLFSESHKLLTTEERKQLRDLLEPGFVFLENLSSSKAISSPVCPCIAKRSIYVSPTGLVQPCNFIPLSFGNIKEEPFGTLIKRVWSDDLMEHDNCQCLMNNDKFREKIVPMIEDADSLPVSQV